MFCKEIQLVTHVYSKVAALQDIRQIKLSLTSLWLVNMILAKSQSIWDSVYLMDLLQRLLSFYILLNLSVQCYGSVVLKYE